MFEEGLLCFERSYELNPNDDVAIAQMGVALISFNTKTYIESLDRDKEAISLLYQAIMINPRSHVALGQMAKTLSYEQQLAFILKTKCYKEAIIFSQKAISLQPQNQQYLEIYYNAVYFQQHNFCNSCFQIIIWNCGIKRMKQIEYDKNILYPKNEIYLSIKNYNILYKQQLANEYFMNSIPISTKQLLISKIITKYIFIQPILKLRVIRSDAEKQPSLKLQQYIKSFDPLKLLIK